MAHRFKAGSILRLALSESLWPLVWPSPEVASLAFHLGDAYLALPVRPEPESEAPFPIPITHLSFSRGEPVLDIQTHDGEVHVHGAWPAQASTLSGIGTELSGSGPNMDLFMRAGEPDSSTWLVTQDSRFRRGDWDCQMRVEIKMTADATHYYIRRDLVGAEERPSPCSTDTGPRRFLDV